MNRTLQLWLLALAGLLNTGCGMLNYATRPAEPLAPVAFSSAPSLPQVMQTINANTERVHTLHSETAAVSTPGYPSLRARLTVEIPRRLRLRAKLFGPELDLGSNDEVFWFWLKSSGQPSVAFARHDQFANSAAQQLMPIEPEWIIESLGLVHLNPEVIHEGPYQRPDGQYEVRSRLPGRRGEVTRTLVIEPTYGWILEQHLTDATNRPLVSAVATNHRYYPEHAVSLPHRVEVRVPESNLTVQIEIGTYTINRPVEDPLDTWSLPDVTGQPPIDLSRLNQGQMGGPSLGMPVNESPSPPMYQPQRRSGFRPDYRGYSPVR